MGPRGPREVRREVVEGAVVKVCECHPEVRSVVTIRPAPTLVRFAKAVVLTICNCDRRKCPVNGCDSYVDIGAEKRCSNGHRT